jgi:hypothetical protein
MLKKRPVVGAVVTNPRPATAATLTRPVAEFTVFCATSSVGKTDPLRSSLTGLRMLGLVRTWISKPLRAAEFWMLTAMTSWPPTLPWNIDGVAGQEVEKSGAMHTVPGANGLVTWTDTTTEWVKEPLVPVTVAL